MQTILLAAELGAGQGHVMRLANAISHARDVVRPVWALRPSGFAHLQRLGLDVGDIVKAPSLPRVLNAERHFASQTLADPLATWGFSSQDVLEMIIKRWRALIDDVKPDLIVADFSPFLRLAAIEHVPMIMLGSGYTTPPIHLPLMQLPTMQPVLAAGQRVCERVLNNANSVLRKIGTAPIERLSTLFHGDETLVCVWPEIDPYRLERKVPHVGPFLQSSTAVSEFEIVSHFHKRAYAYLHRPSRDQVEFLNNIAKAGWNIWLHATSKDEIHSFREGIRQCPLPLRADEITSQFELIVHSGGAGLAQQAMLSGMPQICVPVSAENFLTAKAVAELGSGALVTGGYAGSLSAIEEVLHHLFSPSAVEMRRQLSADLKNRLGQSIWRQTLVDAMSRCGVDLAQPR